VFVSKKPDGDKRNSRANREYIGFMAELIGIEIGGTKLQIVVRQANGGIDAKLRFVVAQREGGVGIRRQIEKALPEILKSRKVSAIGVGFGGPVDWKNGCIRCSHQIEGWADFPLRTWLQELSGLPVAVDNDANVAALGEALHGAGRGFRTVFYVTLGSGVGGGLVVDGKIYHGATPGESEIGHVRLDRTGRTVESLCSGWAVDAKLRDAKIANPRSALAQRLRDANGGEAKFLAELVEGKDPIAERILTETADDLAFGLSHVVHLFHPEVIVLGGGLSLAGEPLRAAVERGLRIYIMEAFAPGPKIALAELKEDPVPMGALALAAEA
jgi:glucokinase